MHLAIDKMYEAKLIELKRGEDKSKLISGGAIETFINFWWEWKIVQSLWKTVLAISYKTKHIFLPFNSATAICSICPENVKSVYCSLAYTYTLIVYIHIFVYNIKSNINIYLYTCQKKDFNLMRQWIYLVKLWKDKNALYIYYYFMFYWK